MAAIKKLLFLVYILLTQLAYSQEPTAAEQEVDEIIDNLISVEDDQLLDLIDDLNKYQIILASVDFNNKTYFLGRDLGLDQYSINTQLMYENSNGIYLGFSGNLYSEFDPNWDLFVLTGGYALDFGKTDNIRFELGYSRYIFSNSESNDFENSIDGNFHLSNAKHNLGLSLNSSYLFGARSGFQSSLAVYGDLKLFDLNSSKGSKVTFGPDLSFIFASENIDTSRIDALGLDFPFINRIVDSFETFTLRNIQLQLPVIFEFNNFQVETGFNINLPSAFDFEDSVDNTTFFNLSLIYLIDLK